MATTTVYADSGDGTVRNIAAGSTSGSWTTLRNASTGTVVNNGGASGWAAYADDRSDFVNQYILRSFFSFDLSSIPAGAVISSVKLRLYGVSGGGDSAGGSLSVYSASQASTSALATSDFGSVGSTAYAGSINFPSWSTAGYNDFTFNSTGLAAVASAAGASGFKLCTRSSFDVGDSKPSAGQWSGAVTYYSEQTGTSSDPKLEVTWSNSGTTSDSWAWSDSAVGPKTTFGALDSWAWSDSAGPAYWRAQRVPVLVRAEGANTTLNGAQNMSSATITVADTTGFPSSGTFGVVFNNGTHWQQCLVDYTGKTGTTFTGCSGGENATYSDGAGVGTLDAESHFPSINVLDATSKPRLLVTYHQHFAHSGQWGKIKGKISADGGLSWGSEQTLLSGPVNTDWGIFGHGAQILSDGTLFVAWYEQQLYPSRVTLRTYCMRGTPDGAGWFTFDTPVQVPSAFGADAMAFGFKVYESGGDLYMPVYGTDHTPYVDYAATEGFTKLIRCSDKGVSGSWTTVGTVCTFAQAGSTEVSECQIAMISSSYWVALLRTEGFIKSYTRCVSTDQGATWSGHSAAVSGSGAYNAPAVHVMPEGHVIVQGGATPTDSRTHVSTDSGSTFPYYRDEQGDATYSAFNGANFATIADTSMPARRVVNAYAQERSNQTGAQVKFQWYAVPNFPLTFDAWAWTDSVARDLVYGRTTSDTWAWQDTMPAARTTSDSWAWTDTATQTQSFNATTSDTLAWSDAATRDAPRFRSISEIWTWTDTSTGVKSLSKTTTDTLAWSDAASAVLNAAPVTYERTTTDTWLWRDVGDQASGIFPFPCMVVCEHYAYPDTNGAHYAMPLVTGEHYPYPKVYAKHGPTEGA